VTEKDSIVGVTPNLAARLQSEAEPGMVVVSDVTQHLVESDFHLASVGFRNLKGISRPVEVFAVTSERNTLERLSSERYRRASLHGHGDAIASLSEGWSQAATGHASVNMMLMGEAGIGKSRLAAHLRDAVAVQEADLLDLGCFPYYTNSALWPVGRLLERQLDIRGERDPAARVSALERHLQDLGLDSDSVVPFLAPLIGVNKPPGYALPELDPTALLQAVLTAVTAWIRALSHDRPTLVIAEDTHWADPSTVGLLSMLCDAALPQTMVLMTSRPPARRELLDAATTIPLDHLDQSDVRAMIADLAGDDQLADDVVDSIVARSEGVPLAVEELTRAALNPTSEARFPVKLQELFTSRLEETGVDLPLAQLAATLGNVFDTEALARLVKNPARLAQRLQSLVEQDIIEKAHSGGYRFVHSLLRDAAYETQIMGERRQAHADIATILDQTGEDQAVIAHHFDLAGDIGQAIARYITALQDAQARGAHTEAITLASRALELVATIPDGPEHSMTELGLLMLRGLSVASMRGYAAPEVEHDYRRAVAISEELQDAPETMPAAIALWSFYLVNGDVGTAATLAGRLQARVFDGSGAWFAPEVAGCIGWQRVFEGELVPAATAFRQSVEGFEQRPDDQKISEYWPLPNDPIAVMLIGQAVVSLLTGDAAAATEAETLAIARAGEVPFPRGPFSMAFVKVYMAWLRFISGDREAAAALGSEVVGIGQQHGYAYWMALGSIYSGINEQQDVAAFSSSIEMLRSIGHEAFRASYLNYLAVLQADAGDLDGALSTLNEGLLVIEKSGERLHLPALLRTNAMLSIRAGRDLDLAVADLRQSVAVSVEQGNAMSVLRSSLAIAELDPGLRPPDWSTMLEKATAMISEHTDWIDLLRANQLLNS
ncbi:MAG: AAA family ATPase, partial [Acidimicrobiales bacterium]|nr:AAA family ATPase [Acidimicrobiales bacterium]